MVENHLAGILAHGQWGLTHAFVEGLNTETHLQTVVPVKR